VDAENPGGVFIHADFISADVGEPPIAALDIHIIRHGARGRHRAGRAIAAAEALQVHAGDVLAVHTEQFGGHGADQLRRPFHAALPLHQIENRVAILGGDVDEENVGHARRRGAIHLGDHAVLHQINREREHDADAQRHQHRLRVRARTIQVRDAMAHAGWELAAAQDLQHAQHQPGDGRERREADEKRAREVFARSPDVSGRARGEGHRDAGESDEDDDAR
jgi:hypothetical protein